MTVFSPRPLGDKENLSQSEIQAGLRFLQGKINNNKNLEVVKKWGWEKFVFRASSFIAHSQMTSSKNKK